MIKAIIFDCFGVLVQDAWFPFIDTHMNNDADKIEQASAALKRVGAGLLDYEGFYAEVAEILGKSHGEVKGELTRNPLNNELFEYIRELSSSYKLAILSNVGSDRLESLIGDSNKMLFDEIVLSYEVGMVKPQPEIYELTAARLGVLPEECLFIDDQPRYVEGSEKVGMQSVLFKNTKSSINKIKEILDA